MQAEGEECVYLYPDIKTGIVGTWRDGLMVTGKPARILNFLPYQGITII